MSLFLCSQGRTNLNLDLLFVLEDSETVDEDDEIMLFKGSKSGIFGCLTSVGEGFVAVEEGTIVVGGAGAAGLPTCPC